MKKNTLEKMFVVLAAINVVVSFCRLVQTIKGFNDDEKD